MRPVKNASFPASSASAAPPWLSTRSDQVVRPAFVQPGQGSGGDSAHAGQTGRGGGDPQQQLQAEIEAAFAQAEAEGRAKGEADGRARLTVMTERVEQLMRTLADARIKVFNEMEGQMIDLSILIAKEILARELSIDRNYVVKLFQEVLAILPERDHIELLVSPADYNVINEQYQQVRAQLPRPEMLSVRTDPSIESGCIVKTPKSIVDATVEQRVKNIARAMQVGALEMQDE